MCMLSEPGFKDVYIRPWLLNYIFLDVYIRPWSAGHVFGRIYMSVAFKGLRG